MAECFQCLAQALPREARQVLEEVVGGPITQQQAPVVQSGPVASDYATRAETAIPGMVRMISGCADTQTSADVSNTASFELPAVAGPGGAGGACTNSMISALSRGHADLTWVQLLDAMRDILDAKGYEQIPQLSASRLLDVENDRFSVVNPAEAPGASRRAVLIGINYVGQRGELRGCHNDVESMRRFLLSQGFPESGMHVLMDDGMHTSPTASNILAAIAWLTDGAKAGDSLFLHYSGHGGWVPDEDGDEADGRDETLVPVDFKHSGQIIDDVLFELLVMPVPEGCQLTCVMDCCHSGTVLDLPYMIKASTHLEGSHASMMENPGFSFRKLFEVAQNLYAMHAYGASGMALAGAAAKELGPMLASKGGQGGLANLLALAGGGAALAAYGA